MEQQYVEIFTLITGLVYLVLEVSQKNAMWIVGIITSAAAVYMFAAEALYASAALNVYYVVISAVGFVHWRRDRARLRLKTSALAPAATDAAMQASGASGKEGSAARSLHLNRLTGRTALWSAAIAAAGTALLFFVLKLTGDSMPYLDAPVAVLNAVATWWLSRSYYQQWYILVFVNILSSVLCFSQDLYWMTAQYVFYSASSVFGLLYWRRRGVYID